MVPLAEVLLQFPKLHHLFPVVHHAVLELQFTQHSSAPCILLYAPHAGEYKATLYNGFVSPDMLNVLIEQGNAQTVTRLLETFVARQT